MLPRNSKSAEAIARYWNKSLAKKDWYSLSDNGDHVEVRIYDVIGWPFIEAQDFLADLDNHKGKDLIVSINSPGGDVFDGFAIYNALKRWDGKVTTRNDGLAASAASFILVSGDEVQSAKNAFVMIHNAWGLVVGNKEDLEKTAGFLDQIDTAIAEHYADKTGKKISDIKDLMSKETWFRGSAAKDYGLVDKVIDQEAAKNSFDLSVFSGAPDDLFGNGQKKDPTIREIENALRDVGVSIAKAKALASAYKDGQRDVDLSSLCQIVSKNIETFKGA